MSRTLKGTRARGLPPKVLLSQRQDATGSFPTVWRTSSDNRTGKYPVFFNDDKVIPFNQFEAADYDSKIPLGNAVYVERVENVGAVETGGTASVNYPTAFAGSPIVVISELSSANGDSSQNVNVFLSASNLNNFTVKFSSQFTGSIVYRAAYDPSPGTLRIVERKPRYPNAFTRFTVKQTTLTASNIVDITFNDFGDDTAENFVTFFDDSGNGQADIWPNITTQTRTLVALTASSIATTTLEFQRFHGLHNRGIIYPLGMNQSAILTGLSQENQIEMYGSVSFMSGAVVNQPTKWIVASGDMKKNIADTFITFTPGQDIQAFRDNSNPAVDGKISSSVNGINPFYATGSAVTVTGQGFQQPLWSKNKLEIDLSVASPVTFGQSTYSNKDQLMAYYDHVQKKYIPIGDARANNNSINQLITTSFGGVSEYFSSKSIGFSQSVRGFFEVGSLFGDAAIEALAGKTFGSVINSFGFPYDHKRYGVGSGGVTNNNNMLFSMQDIISEPFLLEKIVLEFTGVMSSSGTDESGFCAMSTFFILNQTAKNFLYTSSIDQYLTNYWPYNPAPPHYVGPDSLVTSSLNITASNSNVDLVTYLQISALTSSLIDQNSLISLLNPIYTRDLNIYQSATAPVQNSYGFNPHFGYSGSFVVSGNVRSPLNLESGTTFFKNYAEASILGFPVDFTGFTLLANKGGRKNLLQPCGRNWKTMLPANSPPTYINGFSYYAETVQDNPYILLPKDNLIFGWQAPFGNISGSIAGNCGDMAQMHFPVGKGKLTLYGSSLRVNPETNQLEEHHDTLNQLFSSNSIHEIIGD